MSIDVEPDGFQLTDDRVRSTTGYDATVELLAALRPRLAQRTGSNPSFGWFFRMDPQMATVFGRADYLVSGFGTRARDLVDAGDHVGLHSHVLRWSAVHERWVHDLTDSDWVRHVIESGFDAFEQCFGTSCTRHRMGAALFSQELINAIEDSGAQVECALEPVRGGGADGVPAGSGTDQSLIVGRNVDCSTSPRRPYRPARGDFLRPGRKREGLLLLPMTTSWLSPARPAWQTVAGHAWKRHQLPRARMLYLAEEHMSPRQYWDLVARQLRVMRRPYVNVAIRTGAADSPYFARVRAALGALLEHPLATRIAVSDPLDAVSRVVRTPIAVRSSPVAA